MMGIILVFEKHLVHINIHQQYHQNISLVIWDICCSSVFNLTDFITIKTLDIIF